MKVMYQGKELEIEQIELDDKQSDFENVKDEELEKTLEYDFKSIFNSSEADINDSK